MVREYYTAGKAFKKSGQILNVFKSYLLPLLSLNWEIFLWIVFLLFPDYFFWVIAPGSHEVDNRESRERELFEKKVVDLATLTVSSSVWLLSVLLLETLNLKGPLRIAVFIAVCYCALTLILSHPGSVTVFTLCVAQVTSSYKLLRL